MPKRNEDRELEIACPVDFSFKNITTLEVSQVQGARSSRIGSIPEKGSVNKRFLTRSIWLNNNKLTNIKNMDTLVQELLEQPEKLGWIDFSFNYITNIDDSILKFTNLKIVYFHGNKITDINEVCKLRNLKELRSVTFHGNPIADFRAYRNFLITFLPQIVNLDFTPITKTERLQPKPPEALRIIEAYESQTQPNVNNT
ncbi:leucine-rich repeat-containing protein 51-like isoform X2 [Agrilus planipennis]|uniref:Leucine-rich repeat-containing protein 51 n=1 Tax=Agrilus planipennis TaxID=224129 RepID=A0A7F5RE65_AGRPL|nr:leucine-rich repeat-containing protein 51-like isoform X2 [Agrilus planipennis]